MSKPWSARKIFWHAVHCYVNQFAHKYQPRGYDVSPQPWLWRLNDWCAEGWIHEE